MLGKHIRFRIYNTIEFKNNRTLIQQGDDMRIMTFVLLFAIFVGCSTEVTIRKKFPFQERKTTTKTVGVYIDHETKKFKVTTGWGREYDWQIPLGEDINTISVQAFRKIFQEVKLVSDYDEAKKMDQCIVISLGAKTDIKQDILFTSRFSTVIDLNCMLLKKGKKVFKTKLVKKADSSRSCMGSVLFAGALWQHFIHKSQIRDSAEQAIQDVFNALTEQILSHGGAI